MAYSDFDLPTVIKRFQLEIVEDKDLFKSTAEIQPGECLRQTLQAWAPLASVVNTEKARSEWITAPILMEAVRLLEHRVSLFPGVSFDVDQGKGFTGTCDFLLCRSPEHFFRKQPLVAVVEAKREDINGGLGPCAAIMLAGHDFNAGREDNNISVFFGAVTSGTNWHFLKLEGQTLIIDRPEYYCSQAGKILGILVGMLA